MRAQLCWPRTWRDWLPGFIASAPLALLLLATRTGESDVGVLAASVAVVLAVPWIVPATMAVAVASSPVYMWLHTQSPAPAVFNWLGGVVLVAAVVGCHINAALLIAWRHALSTNTPETGLRDFLIRHERRK